MNRHASLSPVAGHRVALMRAEFDAGFSRRSRSVEADLIDVVALKIGAEPCVLRLSDLAEVIARPVLTPVPTSAPALLGLTVGRGVPVAAYDLGLLLGRAPVVPRWLVIAAAEPGVGLAFEHFDGHQRIPAGPDRAQPLLELGTLLAAIARLTAHPQRQQELES